MRKIFLTGRYAKIAFVSNKDFEYLNQWKWYAKRNGKRLYAVRSVKLKGVKKNITILMHRVIMNPPENMVVDHIDHDGLNNQRSNLRLANNSQNSAHSRKQQETTSEYKGVSWHKNSQKWQARIIVNQEFIYLGIFKNPKRAAKAYNQAALKYFGRFAVVNHLN